MYQLVTLLVMALRGNTKQRTLLCRRVKLDAVTVSFLKRIVVVRIDETICSYDNIYCESYRPTKYTTSSSRGHLSQLHN